ncbi:MAG: hypothetical protein PVI30_21345 [Myxococcales bacterium]|jgi:hypothetical protein
MMGKKLATVLVAAAVTLSGIAAFAPAAVEAARLKAQVYIVQKRLPRKLTERKLIAFARRNRAKILRETKEEKLDDRTWRGDLIVAFNRPVGDLEFQVLFYDIQDGPRRFVDDMATFVNDRSQKTFVQRLKLRRPKFKPNRQMQLVVTVKRQEVGRLKFNVVGQEKRRSGVVSFGDDET